MKPIEDGANEYENAIKSYLGVNELKKRKIAVNAIKKNNSSIVREKPKSMPRPRSSFQMDKNGKDELWIKELQKIEEKEKNLQKNINELDLKRKKIQKLSKSVKSRINIQKDDVYESLKQVNKLISKVLQSNIISKATPSRKK